eukprot:scaffold37999_cov214-Skeletonema_marinoi.AAC.17
MSKLLLHNLLSTVKLVVPPIGPLAFTGTVTHEVTSSAAKETATFKLPIRQQHGMRFFKKLTVVWISVSCSSIILE